MAKFKRTGDKSVHTINALAQSLQNSTKDASTAQNWYNKDLYNKVSMESVNFGTLPEVEQYQFETSMESIRHDLMSVDNFGNPEVLAMFGFESVDDIPAHSLEAAQILVAASGNLQGYNLGQLNVKADPRATQVSQEMLNFGVANLAIAANQQSIATESFDEKELNKYLQYSIIYNVMASRQDAFNELFFKPLTVTPDEVGYRVSVRVEEVWQGNEHDPNGDPNEIIKEKLIDALVHPEILEANATEIIPYVQSGGSIDNTAHFVDEADVAPYNVSLEGVAIKTAPLKINERHSLLGLSSHPTLIANELMNDKDSLDSSIKLKRVYVKVDGKVVKYDTELLYTSGFYKSIEGNMRSMALTFDNGSFSAANDVKAIDGTDVAPFKALTDAGYDVRFSLRLVGDAAVDHGYVEISALPARVSSVKKDGQTVPFSKEALANDATLKGLLDALKIEVIGYDLAARRTNYNLRTRGRMIDSTEYTEQLTIPLRSPISIIKPVVGGEKEYPDVKALVAATRIQANNDGVATILNHAQLLKRVVSQASYTYGTDRNGLPGIGRHFLQPCYLEADLHLPDLINSVSSGNRLNDIQGAITTKLNELVGRALKTSNYIPVVEQLTGGSVGKVKVIIGTDFRLPQYLNVQGDIRLFGNQIGYEIASTANKHMSDKIVMSIVRENSEEGPDPFYYGNFAWTPELMVSCQMQRGSSTYQQHLVQPRYLHIVNTNILIVVNITGIEEVTGEATVLNVSPTTKEEAAKVGNGTKYVAPAPKQVGNKPAPAGGTGTGGAGGTPSGTNP